MVIVCSTSIISLFHPLSTKLLKLWVGWSNFSTYYNILMSFSHPLLYTHPAYAGSKSVPVLTEGLNAPQYETHVGHESSETQHDVQIRTRHLYQSAIKFKIKRLNVTPKFCLVTDFLIGTIIIIVARTFPQILPPPT